MKDNDLFYLCSLIEYISRLKFRRRKDVVNKLGEERLRRIYIDAPVLHCELIDYVANEYARIAKIRKGRLDIAGNCRYLVPDYWDIGDVYCRLITDVNNGDLIKTLIEVYNSKMSDELLNFNTALYYQSRQYIALSYKAGQWLD